MKQRGKKASLGLRPSPLPSSGRDAAHLAVAAEDHAGAPAARHDFRDTILEAARRVIDDEGLQSATTRRIAEVAGCAEGTIYRHFEDKHELFHELLAASAPGFLDLVAELPDLAGQGTVEGTLRRLGLAALRFFRAVLPFVGGSIVDPELREEQRRRFDAGGHGPVHALRQLERYLRAEAELGRLRPDVPTGVAAADAGGPAEVAGPAAGGLVGGAATALLGAMFSRAYLDVWLGKVWLGPEALGGGADEDFVAGVVEALLRGLCSPR